MANTIQHKRSSTATTVPTSGQLSAGELAVNTADGKLYLKKDDASIVQVGAPAWSIITTDQTAAINTGYIVNKGTLLTLTLPTTAAVGSVIRVSGMNAGLWKIAQNASEIIHFGKTDTTTGVGGYISSTLARDAVELVCCVANNEWNVISSIGNITIV